jgi:large subunit ribosomal protein L3
VQLGFDEQKPHRVTKPVLGHVNKFGRQPKLFITDEEKAAALAAAEAARKAAEEAAAKQKAEAEAAARKDQPAGEAPPQDAPAEGKAPESKAAPPPAEQKATPEPKKEPPAPEFVVPEKIPPVKRIGEFRDFSLDVQPGHVLRVNVFRPGDFVDAIGVTKGRGFEGVVKRHHFRGGDSTHGAKGWHRRSGAIGCRLFPGTVQRGMKMPGHMGQVRRTAQNLEIVRVLLADNLLLIKGSMPGAEGDYVILRESKKRSRAFEAERARRQKEAAEKQAARGKGKGGARPAAKPAAAPASK